MYYHFDIIGLMIFLTGSIILVFKRKEIKLRSIGFAGMYLITFTYLIIALILTSMWHAQTGEMLIRAHYEMDVLHFALIFALPPFLLLYFVELCSVRLTKGLLALIFGPALVLFTAYIVLNVLGNVPWVFSYENGQYERGPLFWTGYALWITYIVISLIIMFRHRTLLGSMTVNAYVLCIAFEALLQVFAFGLTDFYPHGIAFSLALVFFIIIPLLLDSGRDPLTGRMDRSGFLRAAGERTHREPAGTYQIIAVDIHQFRDINNRFGSEVGDTVLTRVGQRLKASLPSDAFVARFNADHFFACTPNCDPGALPASILLRELVPELPVSYDIFLYSGIYPVEDSTEDVGRMCDCAAFTLENIKGDFSKNYAYFSSELQDRMTMQAYVLHEMRNAIANKNFAIYLQPIYNVQKNQISSVEALVRWVDDRYGIIPPGDFIPLFEKNGFISELDSYVRNQVCELIRTWKDAGLHTYPISVNVSRTELLDAQLPANILQVLDEHGLTCKDMRVEITESAFVRPEEIIDTLESMHASGLMVLMDDFGSGYSNFNTFASMPVDVLKSDVGFVQSLDQSERGHRVLASIRDMADQLSIPIVAEGVETQEQLDYLSALGFEYAQGYHFARPMPAADFEKLLKTA